MTCMVHRSAVILPMDTASVVVPTAEFGGILDADEEHPFESVPNIVLKRRDGELHRIVTVVGEPRTTIIDRRDEFDASWTEGVGYGLADGVLNAADQQGFGIRRDREPSSISHMGPMSESELVEIEPLHRGGIIVDSDQHLPVVLHRRDLTMWRLRKVVENIPSDITDSNDLRSVFLIERRDSYRDDTDWELVDWCHPDGDVKHAAMEFGESVGVPVLTDDISGNAIDAELEQHPFWFGDATDDEKEQWIRDKMGIQDNTVLFEDEVPDDLDFGL